MMTGLNEERERWSFEGRSDADVKVDTNSKEAT